ncbi:MAG: hypothetical protein CVV53_07870 [Spirochaetae bacterium HGW-Spirochaetae-9]|nr:MAG: hypothetical protein CVV53_07870 [Spirochaetae bacterium HGW-Spirochaetae-9]
MFGIGFSEFALIALVCVIFIKPDDLPAFFRKLGKLFLQAKKAYKEVTAVKDDFMREMDIAAALQDAEKDKEKAKAAEVKDVPAAEAAQNDSVEAEGQSVAADGD